MPETESINYIAWWGAALSTILAMLKLAEVWRDRFRVHIGYQFSSEPEQGNQIFVRNLGARPIIVSYWEVLYGKGHWPFRKFTEVQSPGPDACDLRIMPHYSSTFTFSGGQHFLWGGDEIEGCKIYMRLYIAGKKPLLKKIYG